LAFYTISHSVGYFGYDLCQIIVTRAYLEWPSMVAHHLVVMSIFLLGLSSSTAIGYSVLGLACELHTVFMHVRKLFFLSSYSLLNSRLCRWLWVVNWMSLGITRIVVHCYVLYSVISDNEQFEIGGIVHILAVCAMVSLVALDGDVSDILIHFNN
jgi:hypothetical protein